MQRETLCEEEIQRFKRMFGALKGSFSRPSKGNDLTRRECDLENKIVCEPADLSGAGMFCEGTRYVLEEDQIGVRASQRLDAEKGFNQDVGNRTGIEDGSERR